MEFFAYRMGYLLVRPMIDRTGIKGDYDFAFDYTIEPPPSMHEGMLVHNGQPVDFFRSNDFHSSQDGIRLATGRGPLKF